MGLRYLKPLGTIWVTLSVSRWLVPKTFMDNMIGFMIGGLIPRLQEPGKHENDQYSARYPTPAHLVIVNIQADCLSMSETLQIAIRVA